MAIVLKFKQGDSGTELNLNAGTTGFQLAGQGWSPAVATPAYMGDPAPVGETIHLLLAHSSHNNIATSMQSLHEMQVLANRYINDTTQDTPVWLHAKMDNETGERRALVYSITAQYKTSWFGEPATALDIPLVLTVVRGPFWENTTVRNLPDSGTLSGANVVYDYTAAGTAVGAHDIVGDVGARIRFNSIYDEDDGLVKFWMGIRSADKHGADGITNFKNIWECEDGTNNAGESGVTDQVDATASGGDIVQLVETDLDWDEVDFKEVCNVTLSDISAAEEDQRGRFLWLLRTKVTAGTWEVMLKINTALTTYQISREIVEVSDTDWRFLEMTIAEITDRNVHAILNSDIPTANEPNFRVSIFARRTSGAGNLKVDCIVPLPVDEGFCKLDLVTNFTDYCFGQSPEGTFDSMAWTDTTNVTSMFSANPVSIENFVLPPGDGRIYCVFERTSSSDISDNLVFNNADIGRYYERWLSLRGSE